MNKDFIDISIVAPLYNEEQVFDALISRLTAVLDNCKESCEVILVDDGSSDRTAALIEGACIKDSRFTGIILSRNHGHQIAVSAGLANVRGKKATMIIDGDLQDPPELLEDFYKLLQQGYDVVYAIRRNRKESFIKKAAYKLYYRLQKSVSNFTIPIDSGDFCMISRRVVDTMNAMPEQSRYLRGMRAWVGFKQFGYEYERDERQAGNTKYSWAKLFQLAFNGIFNFSDFPVRLISRMGLFSITLSFIYLCYILIRKVFFHDVPEGFTTTLGVIILFSGVQLVSLGLIGEYVLRIYNQVKNRPLFIVNKIVQDGKEITITK